MSSAPVMVYGVVNLILSLVSVGGLVILIVNVSRYVRTLSHAIFVCVFLVLVDGFVNVILFITSEASFNDWCIKSSSQTITQEMNATVTAENGTLPNFDFAADYYNCHNLWQDELKFGIIFYILMFAFYIYWARCIYSFSVFRREYATEADFRDNMNHRDSGMPMMGVNVNVPPAAMLNGNPGLPGAYPNDRNVIVLNNQKPRSKTTKKKKEVFSFRNIKKSIVPSTTVAPLQTNQLNVPFIDQTRRDSQFTIGFRLGPDGNIIDIENAPSPTPTYINASQHQQNLKRKLIKEEQQYPHEDEDGYY
ncbi:hypothetical protein HPULCUR_005096 [Helicostylum pulchrum]|uniref:Uncharacterized protein n=1 Tax=Helicostylum pulchrum TaxID=562976 RepID=A0ABP9XY42_9FUNG